MITKTQTTKKNKPMKITQENIKKYKFNVDKFNIEAVLKKLGYEVESEFKFNPDRQFRADYKISKNNKTVLVEYEGLMSTKSRHTSPRGYTMDCEKYNLMTKMDYKLLRYTVLNFNDIINDLEEVLG